MRKVLPLAFAVLLVAAACGEGEEAQVGAGQSGEAPVPETVVETTTVPETTTTTLPQQVVEIPDVADLGLTWNEVGEPDPMSGAVNVSAFNELLIADAPNAMVPEGTFAEIAEGASDVDEAEDLVAEAYRSAKAEAPLKAAALYLGLEPDTEGTQMMVAQQGGPEAWRVVVVQSVEDDDSVRAIRWEFVIQNQARAGFQAAEQETEQAEEGLSGDAEEAAEGQDQSEETPEGTEEEEDTQGTATALTDVIPIVYTLHQTTQCQPDRGHQDFAIGECV
jgi:hypothetical protein